MRKIAFSVIITMFILGITFFCHAQMGPQNEGKEKRMIGGTMHSMPMENMMVKKTCAQNQGMGKCMMCGMMQNMPMGNMMGRNMSATSDGGVVVMIRNKLYKYDKDLNLVKEVELPLDMDHMKKMMEMKGRRMMGETKNGTETTEPQKESGHVATP